eukprot:6055315-Amphidinium_carterae.1
MLRETSKEVAHNCQLTAAVFVASKDSNLSSNGGSYWMCRKFTTAFCAAGSCPFKFRLRTLPSALLSCGSQRLTIGCVSGKPGDANLRAKTSEHPMHLPTSIAFYCFPLLKVDACGFSSFSMSMMIAILESCRAT